MTGARPQADQALVQAPSPPVSALTGFDPSRSIFENVAPNPVNDLVLDDILLAVDRRGEAIILDASPDFYSVDLITEHYACDNGIDVPKGLAPGLYRMTNIRIRGDNEDCEIHGDWSAIAIEARSDATGTGAAEGESAAIAQGEPDCPQCSDKALWRDDLCRECWDEINGQFGVGA